MVVPSNRETITGVSRSNPATYRQPKGNHTPPNHPHRINQSGLQEVKHDQNVLQAQNEKLHEEVRALRAQIEALPSTSLARSWAAVAASGSHPYLQPNHQHTDKDQNYVRISTQRSLVDPRDNDDGDENTFSRYLPTEAVNTYIRTALLSAPST